MVSATDMQARIDALTEQLETALGLNSALQDRVRQLEEQLLLAQQWRFGRRSERLEPGQLDLFKSGAAPAVPEPEASAPAAPRKQPSHGRAPFPAHLPRHTVVLDVPESERVCSCCGEALQPMGVEVTERGQLEGCRSTGTGQGTTGRLLGMVDLAVLWVELSTTSGSALETRHHGPRVAAPGVDCD